jgi:hypothetical protein
VNRFRSTRNVDPLQPTYVLPTAVERPPSPPPFKRDLHSIDDIAGTKSSAYLPWQTRSSNVVEDIAGTRPRPRTLTSSDHVSQLHVRDINEDGVFRSRRTVDPLRPTHVVHGRVVADDDPGMYVKSPPKGGHRPFLSLTTDDIEGARGSFQQQASVGGIHPDQRRHFRVTNFLGDMPEAAVGSKAHGLRTVRMTDPQERDYVLLDGRRWGPDELTVGKSWYTAAATLAAAEAAEQAATLPMGRTGIAAAIAPAQGYARKILDPRDAEIARLRGQLDTLSKERELTALSRELATLREGKKNVGSAGAVGGAGAAAAAAAAASTAAANAQPGPAGGSRVPTPKGDVVEVDVAGVEAAAPRRSSRSANTPADAVVDRPARASAGVGAAAPSAAARPPTYVPVDPLAALRSTAAASSARNILGVIPATRPQQDLQHTAASATATLRGSGRYDSLLDKYPAAARGAAAATSGRGGAASMGGGGGFRDVHAQRMSGREHRAEVAEVRGLPS